jgi:hypothetical protein
VRLAELAASLGDVGAQTLTGWLPSHRVPEKKLGDG